MATDLSIYEGEDKAWTVTINDSTGTPIDITDYTFLFTVKKNKNDSDSVAIIKKTITSHIDPTNGQTSISIDSADTDNKNGDYFYDYQLLNSLTKRTVVLKAATFNIEQRIGDKF